MIRYLLDTDHVSLLESRDVACLERLAMMDLTEVAITAVTVEERIQGWMNSIRQASVPQKADRLVWAYRGLRLTVQHVASFQLLDWSAEAGDRFLQLRKQGIRIGTQDLRIASIALSVNAIVVTRNHKDFSQVPGLTIEDWSR